LLAGDLRLAQQVIAGDAAFDLLQHRIKEKAISIIATRQPVAIDLRQIVSAIRIAGDLERIGDLAKNVAKRDVAIGERRGPIFHRPQKANRSEEFPASPVTATLHRGGMISSRLGS